MIDLTPIINVAILIVSAVVARYVIPWINTNKTKEQREELAYWIKIGVAAAEQIYKGPGRGEKGACAQVSPEPWLYRRPQCDRRHDRGSRAAA